MAGALNYLMGCLLAASAPPPPSFAFVEAVANASDTTYTITIPSGVISTDLLILGTLDRSGGSGNPVVITDDDTGGNSWTAPSGNADDTAGPGGWGEVFYKYATGSTASKTISISSVSGGSAAVLFVFRGTHQTFASAVIFKGSNSLSSGTNSVASVSLNTGGIYVLAVGNRQNSTFSSIQTTNGGALTTPSGYTAATSLGLGGSFFMAYEAVSGIGSTTGGASWTPSTNAGTVVFQFVVMPP